MAKQRKILENITDEEERIIYFEKVVLPEMTALEAKEQRTWDKHRADFNLDILDRRNDKDDRPLIIPKMLVEACGVIDIEDKIFSKNPADIHEITADRGLAYLLKQCTDRQKKLLFYIDIHGFSGTKIAKAEGVCPRNVTSVHARTLDDIRTQLLPLILFKFKLEHSPEWENISRDKSVYTIYEERYFCAKMGEEYLEYWNQPYFEGVTFNLLPITEHFNAEPKRKLIKKRKPKKYRKNNH